MQEQVEEQEKVEVEVEVQVEEEVEHLSVGQPLPPPLQAVDGGEEARNVPVQE